MLNNNSFPLRFDFHTHVGHIPASSKKNNTFTKNVSPVELADFLILNKITHTVCLYSKYSLLEEVARLVPNCKIYGVKWINDPEFDSLDQGKPLYYGVKLHSHRSSYERNGKQVMGLDYSDSRIMDKILSRLNPGELVYMHTQESISPMNYSSPKGVLKNARKYFHLKFIIGHSGHYGGFAVVRPVDREVDYSSFFNKEDVSYLHNLSQYVLSKSVSEEAVLLTKYFPNIWLDSSVYTKQKADALKNCDRWCIGTDFPFGDVKTYTYDNQLKSFLKHMPISLIEKTYINTISFIETPIGEVWRDFHKDNEYSNKGTPKKRKGYIPGRNRE